MKAVRSTWPSAWVCAPVVLIICGVFLTKDGTSAPGPGSSAASASVNPARRPVIGGVGDPNSAVLISQLNFLEHVRQVAQRAASEGRGATAQSGVRKKYQKYNKQLQAYVKNVHKTADEVKSGKLPPDKAKTVGKTVMDETLKASQGAEESAKALQEFRARVEADTATMADEQRKQKALKEEQALIAEERRLLAQIDDLRVLRGQVGDKLAHE